MTIISLGSATDPGKRETNEDSLLAVVAHAPGAATLGSSSTDTETSALLILADGMGGRAKGQLASRTAVKSVYRELAHILALRHDNDREYLESSLHNALRQANTRIKDIGEGSPDSGGMGTTCTVGVITGGMLALAHVGDSRAYLVRPDQKIEALTEDHSVVAGEVRAGRLTEDEARKSKFRNVITRAVGVDEEVVADVQTFSLIPGELAQVVITSDGLHGAVEADRIDEIVRASKTPQEAADLLVEEAKTCHAKDNISVIVARVESTQSKISETPLSKRRRRAQMPGNVLAFLIGILLTGFLAWVELPGLLSPKPLLVALPIPINSTPPQITDLKSVIYAASKPLIGRGILGSVLLRSGDDMIVIDPAAHRVLRVEPDGKVLTSIPDSANLSAIPAQDAYWAADSQGNVYKSVPAKDVIHKYDPEGKLLGSVGQGLLTEPEAITVAENGDVYVIDQNTLKLFKAEPEPAAPSIKAQSDSAPPPAAPAPVSAGT